MSVDILHEFASIVGGRHPSDPIDRWGPLELHGAEGVVYAEGGNIEFMGLSDIGAPRVGLFLNSGEAVYPQTGWVFYRVQVWVRADEDPRNDPLAGLGLATNIFEHIHGWTKPVGYLGEINYILSDAAPQELGYDERKRREWMFSNTVRASKQ